MKKAGWLLLLLLYLNSFSQESSLVYLNSEDMLEYVPYSNTGEDSSIHTIPDFSHAGYLGGGAAIPEPEVTIELSPVEGDNLEQIQAAIDQVSSRPVDENGIRGVILLKQGMYNISGPVYIQTSGVVLRGEGQNNASTGGTQLHATGRFQHALINVSGAGYITESTLPHIDTIIVPQREIVGTDTTDGNIWLSADVFAAIEPIAGVQELTFWIKANNDDFSSYHSKEGANKPFLEITFRPQGAGSDSVFKVYPTHDAYVRGGENSSVNYGTRSLLELKNQEGDDYTREAFLKFSVPAFTGTAKNATLNLWCSNAGNSGDVQHYITKLEDNHWDELSVTYANRPETGIVKNLIKTRLLPVGANTLELSNIAGYSIGDRINIVRTPNQQWIDALNMAQYGWEYADYKVNYNRNITAINAHTITVDVPMVQAIDSIYGGGYVEKISVENMTTHCGIENMLITSHYSDDEDEAHGWTAIKLSNTENCWVQNVSAQYFGYACAYLDNANFTTIQECAMLDPKSLTDGGRKYSFYIDGGTCNLFQRCYTRGGRHDFITGARVPGPNVFLDCLAEETDNDIGPHHRYATGILFDNIRGGLTRVQNRKDMGTGHGWAGAQTMFWNLEAMDHQIKVESPVGGMNWGVGCIAEEKEGDGYWDIWGAHVLPRSLYLQQLKDRLGEDAVNLTTIKAQREGTIYTELELWAGIGEIGEVERRTYSELTIPGVIEFEAFDRGENGVAYFDNSEGNNGFTSRYGDVDVFSGSFLIGNDIEDVAYVGDVEQNEWLEYTIGENSGSSIVDIQYSAVTPGQRLVFHFNGLASDTLLLEETNSLTSFTKATYDLEISEGIDSVIRVEMLGDELSLDMMEFKNKSSAQHNSAINKVRVYPNPVKNQLFFKGNNAIEQVIVYDLAGIMLNSVVCNNVRSGSLDFNSYPSGGYLLEFVSSGNNSCFQKLIKK